MRVHWQLLTFLENTLETCKAINWQSSKMISAASIKARKARYTAASKENVYLFFSGRQEEQSDGDIQLCPGVIGLSRQVEPLRRQISQKDKPIDVAGNAFNTYSNQTTKLKSTPNPTTSFFPTSSTLTSPSTLQLEWSETICVQIHYPCMQFISTWNSPLLIIQKMNTDNIRCKMVEHVPTLQGKTLVLEKLSGLTNVTYAIYVNQEPLFIFKTFSDGFDREMENRIVQTLSERDMSPRVIAADQHFRIEEFLINTTHPSNEQLGDPALQRRILQHMHLFHKTPLLHPRPSLPEHLFSQNQRAELRQYRHARTNSGGSQEQFLALFDKVESILQGGQQLREQLLPSEQSSLRLCHNDLNNLNILMAGERLHFIDYDYVGSNYLAYDIANFIAETTIDYSHPAYPGFAVTHYLTSEEIAAIARMYPGYYLGLEGEVRRMMCVSSLYWAVWSIKRFPINTSENFGVAEHGLMRLALFDHYYSLLEAESIQ